LDAAPDLGKNFDAAPAPYLSNKPTFSKQSEQTSGLGQFFINNLNPYKYFILNNYTAFQQYR
jgi:hypothetical protein